jgi:hypothetical protein
MSHLYLLGVATLTLTSAGFAGSDTNADLQARLEAAEARINELSVATNTNNWLNDTRSDEIRSLVHDVLADADTRASLQGSGSTAGYNNGFTISSADGNWSMKINGLIQERWIYDDVDNRTDWLGEPEDNSEWGFETHTALLNFSGSIAGDYGYNIRHHVGGDGTGDDWAYGTIDLEDGWSLSAGNMKVAMSREWLINEEFQQAVARSYRGGDWGNSDGIALNYAGDDMRLTGQFMNHNADSGDSYDWNDSSYKLVGRLEWMFSGNWSQFDQFTSENGAASGTLLGVSLMREDNGNDVPNSNNTWINVDLQMEFGGSNLYAAYSHGDEDGANSNPTNFTAQYGIYLEDDFEVFARFQEYDSDENNDDSVSVFGIGFNWYLSGQNAKWSTDFNWADDGMQWADRATGWQVSGADNDQMMVRTQLQFYF